MTQSPDHPELVFVQAAGYTKGRPDGPPLWIVVHDMEASEWSGRAESTAAYFANPADGRSVSAHYCVDDNSVVQCVRLADSAWTVGNRPGNNRGINWELSGFARQTREQWLDAFGLAMFRQMAPYVRSDAVRFGIPLRRCTIDDLTARRPGVTSHNDLRIAFGGTDHTDPGPAYPWDVFMGVMRGDDGMEYTEFAAHLDRYIDERAGGSSTSPTQRQKRGRWRILINGTPETDDPETVEVDNLSVDERLTVLEKKLDAIAAAVAASPPAGLVAHTHGVTESVGPFTVAGQTGPAEPTT